MSPELANAVALKMFVADQKIGFGKSRPDAEASWRALGAEGRKYWRDLAMVAAAAIKEDSAKPAARSGAQMRS